MSKTLSQPEPPLTGESPAPWFAAPPVFSEPGWNPPEWYADFQKSSWEAFVSTPDPVRRDEAWRFSDLRKVRFSELLPSRETEDTESLVERAKASRLEEFAAHFVFANNRLVHSETGELPDGAVCLPLREALDSHGDLIREHFVAEGGSLGGEKFRSLHGAATVSGTFLHFPKNCTVDKPVLIHHFVGGDFQAAFPHTLVVAEDHASVSVVESFESIREGEQSLNICAADLFADRGAQIQYASLQNLSDVGAKHVMINHSRAGRDARIKTAFVNLGAAWVRNESVNRMQGPGADIQIFSANLVDGSQEYDQRTLQSHEAQHTTSDLLFKNAIYDQARIIFGGLIQVREGAHFTDSFQTCRNLLGSETAEANAMPGLEINADQVKCSHGSTSGQISEEEIFYLRARGIPEETARQMISLGFVIEALQGLDGAEVRDFLTEQIRRKYLGLGS